MGQHFLLKKFARKTIESRFSEKFLLCFPKQFFFPVCFSWKLALKPVYIIWDNSTFINISHYKLIQLIWVIAWIYLFIQIEWPFCKNFLGQIPIALTLLYGNCSLILKHFLLKHSVLYPRLIYRCFLFLFLIYNSFSTSIMEWTLGVIAVVNLFLEF